MAIASVKVDKNELLRRAKKSTHLNESANELEIFYYLCVGRVYYKKSTKSLYFVDSPEISVSEIIHKVFKGLHQQADIQQLYMDEHGLFNAAFKLKLNDKQATVLLVALRLRGISIKFTKE